MKLFFMSIVSTLLWLSVHSQTAIIIDSGSVWKYWANTQANAPAASWNGGAGFNDAAWPSGVAKLGFGDGAVTPVPAGCGTLGNPGNCSPKYITTYFRKSFTLSNKDAYTGFIIRLLRDDGAVVYVNGVEVWRSNMDAGAVTYATEAPEPAVGGNDEFTFFESPVIPTTAFVTGNNIIAVEVHQNDPASTDLGFNLQLTGQLAPGTPVMAMGAVWKYWANTEANAPSANWKGGGAFDDSGWPSGPGRLGFGSDGEVTVVPAGCGTLPDPGNCSPKYTTTYFRTTVNVLNPSSYHGFYLNLTRDDGAVIYVNGTEVWRTGMPSGAVNYNTFAQEDLSGQSDGLAETAIFTSPAISPSVFVNGANTIAVEVHQVNAISSDLGFDMELVGMKTNAVVLDFGGSWKYWANNQSSAPAYPAWYQSAYNDAAWFAGNAKFGYGEPNVITCVKPGDNCTSSGAACDVVGTCTGGKYWTTYFRRKFNVSDLNSISGFLIKLVRDDGAVIYVNGQEVWRSNMPAGAVNYSTPASANIESPDDDPFVSPFIPKSFFTEGENTIAVEVHQQNTNTTDLAFNLRLEALPAGINEVIYMWSGAVTSTSAKVTAKLTSPTTQARLVVSTSPSLSAPVYGPYVAAETSHNLMVTLPVSGLSPNTTYYFAVQSDGLTDNSAEDVGSFKTFGNSAYSFKFTASGCGLNSNHPAYTRMAEKNPNLFVAVGDFHYANPNSGTDINVHRMPYEANMLSQPASKAFFKNVPLAYMWDDHDYAGNDSDSTSAGKTNARLAYQEYVPHYPMPRGSGDVPIYQAFTVGRVHFIMTDLRSTRKQGSVIWDAAQKQWFKDQCIHAKNNNLTVAWINGVSFGGNQADNWGGFSAERTEISNFFRDNAIQYMFIISGDAHMLAIDNGANHDFSTGSNNPFDYPVFATAPLNQSGGNKGGNYNVRPNGTVDPAPGANYVYIPSGSTEGQYGLIEVNDNGIQLCVTFTGYRVNSAGVETQLTTYNFCRTADGPLPIRLTTFTAKATGGQNVRLDWQVNEQTECGQYQVERSADGNNFTTIATVACHASNDYFITDGQALNGDNFYRIKMIETTGSFTYSPVRKAFVKPGSTLVIAPNPLKGDLKFKLKNNRGQNKAGYVIYDAAGKVLLEGSVMINGAHEAAVTLPALAAGTYILQVSLNGQETRGQFIVR